MTEQNQTVADQNQEMLKEIKDKTGQKYDHSTLKINRVPDHTIQDLKDLSYDKFAGDYGMTLAFLIETYNLKDSFDKQVETANQKIIELMEEVEALKQELQNREESEDSKKVDTIG